MATARMMAIAADQEDADDLVGGEVAGILYRSAGKRKRERQRKGNTYVRRLLCEFVQAARKTQSMFQAKHKALTITRGFKRAIMACARKMLRIIWAMLLRNEPYRDATVDYEALSIRRNAPRWIRALKRHGYLPASAATR